MTIYHTPIGPVEMLEWGEGEETVVLLHAAAAGPTSLAGLARALARPGRRIVAPALAGYGGTAPAGGDPLDGHIAVVNACLGLLGARPRVLFGHSMGGLVALLAAPAVDAMVLYEPITLGLLHDDDPADRAARAWDHAIVGFLVNSVARGDPEPGVARFVAAWNELAWDALPPPARARLVDAAPRLAAEVTAGGNRALRLDRIVCPVTILQGGKSPPITDRMTARLADALPDGRRVMLPLCGHMGPVQAATMVAAAFP